MKHFDDLTKIDCPFGELDDDTKTRLVVAIYVGNKECEMCADGYEKYTLCGRPTLYDWVKYRLKPEPEMPDSINWDHVHPDYNYMARDKGQPAYFYTHSIHVNEKRCKWSFDEPVNGGKVIASCFASYKQGNLPWDKSLIERPNRK